MKVREVVRVLKDNGFRHERWKGSHRQFVGVIGGRRRLVTVAGKEGDEMKRSTLASITRQSGLPPGAFGGKSGR